MTDDRRERYATAIYNAADGGKGRPWGALYESDREFHRTIANATTAVADAEQTTLQARVADLEALIADFVDPDPCYYDHHGYCQAHGWFTTEPACPHARAKTMLPDEQDKAEPPRCAECRHPKADHQDADEPVSVGLCTACDEADSDDAHHNYEPAKEA